MRRSILATMGVALVTAPEVAFAADRLGAGDILLYSNYIAQAMMIAMVGAALAAIAITVRKVTSGPTLTGGSAFISALRLGAPLLGLLGAMQTVFDTFIGLANIGAGVSFIALTPIFAEGTLVFIVGLITGIVAVVCHAVVEARIDRAVLSS